ncbi:hypothetical protein [Neorhizobium alkalisoli]|uniref:Uncharacterized protein n=1 Tax=Neorhizobium alkalisoli TaxID=528178 RepID=A0A561QHA3_9HYPH|nr:hypothetical protein [Neorhizobium alkalisoli]TWF49755.1 hypothetical protein FHW37_107122 [Neorhizobium alkalisoli]
MDMLLEVHRNLEKLATMGEREREDARSDNVSSFYVDPAFGDYIVEEKPDGVKVLTPFTPLPHADAAE